MVLLKLFLAAVQQQFAEVHKHSWLVWGWDFQLNEENVQVHLSAFFVLAKIRMHKERAGGQGKNVNMAAA